MFEKKLRCCINKIITHASAKEKLAGNASVHIKREPRKCQAVMTCWQNTDSDDQKGIICTNKYAQLVVFFLDA